MVYWFLGLVGLMMLVGILAARHASQEGEVAYLVAGRNLGPVMLGLSAGATGNSGFIMIGAVGLGYSAGTTWLFMPLAWFLGELFFWKTAPHRMNSLARARGAFTVSQLLSGTSDRTGKVLAIVSGAFLVAAVGSYAASQLVAASKVLSPAFGLRVRARITSGFHVG